MKRLVGFLFAFGLLLPATAWASPGTGIAGYWNLNESSGNAADASGNGFTLTNNNTVTYGAGLLANAANFGNPNTNRTLNRTSIITGGNITIHAWVKLNTAITASSWGLFEQEDDTAARIFNVIYNFNGGTPQISADYHKNNVSDNTVVTTFSLSTTVWHDIDVTYDGTNFTLLIDCVPQGSIAISGGGVGSVSGNEFTLGAAPRFSIFAPIQMDDTLVYNRAFSTAESCQLYNGGTGRTPVSFASSVTSFMRGTTSLMRGTWTFF